MKSVILRSGRDSSLRRHHPWIFSGALGRAEAGAGQPGAGETVMIREAGGEPLALAAWSPDSQIRARVWTFDTSEAIDAAFFRRRLEQAISRRGGSATAPDRACRLVHGEADQLPGVIVDRYAEHLVCQFLSTGAEAWKETIADLLIELLPCRSIYERSDVSIRAREGLEPSTGLLRGSLPGEPVDIVEADARYRVDIEHGHKTGFYLDQAANRQTVRAIAAGRSVLNCFSYTGAFGIAALQGDAAHVVNVDASEPALRTAAEHMALNGFGQDRYENICGNAFQQLRQFREEQRQFDMIILDPPKFAENRGQLKKASRAYKDIALQAAHLLGPGGLLLTFSCSGAVDLPLFQKITADAFLDAERNGQIVRFLHQNADHPVALPFPESLYLKGLLCRVD